MLNILLNNYVRNSWFNLPRTKPGAKCDVSVSKYFLL